MTSDATQARGWLGVDLEPAYVVHIACLNGVRDVVVPMTGPESK